MREANRGGMPRGTSGGIAWGLVGAASIEKVAGKSSARPARGGSGRTSELPNRYCTTTGVELLSQLPRRSRYEEVISERVVANQMVEAVRSITKNESSALAERNTDGEAESEGPLQHDRSHIRAHKLARGELAEEHDESPSGDWERE
ncbi:MAG: hypothetical protein RIQ87_204 [Chloroflexota bacterium]